MNKIITHKNLSYLSMIIALIGTIVFYNIYQANYSKHFIHDFIKMNMHELSIEDSASIAVKLNSISESQNIEKIIAYKKSNLFFKSEKNHFLNFLALKKIITVQNITILFHIRLPLALELYFVFFLLILCTTLILFIKLSKHLQMINDKKILTLSNNLAGITKQLAHDIRSPLAALDMLLKDISAIPENKRILLRNAVSRIHDIANDLLDKNRNQNDAVATNISSKHLISALLQSIISEKRIQYRNLSNLTIEADLGESAYGIFANVNAIEFKRAFSNLINNSVEAFENGNGKIYISLYSIDDKSFQIKIEDNGKGIPAHIIDRLGIEGETHNKKGGSGLGIFHSKKMIESLDGNFNIKSTEGCGTTITITLPKTAPPKTFVSKLNFEPSTTIAIIDDDQAIHNIWKGRFESLGDHNIKLIHFTDPANFLQWQQDNIAHYYLIDYEFLGSNLNGINVINGLKESSKAYLVTSRFEEAHIIEECEHLKIGLIPKGLAGFIPINFMDTLNCDENVKTILLDDDELLRITWEYAAKAKGIKLISYSHPTELFNEIKDIHPDSTIYIDAHLGENISGIEIAKKLNELGFKNLILATGYEADEFENQNINFFKNIIGKNAPF